MNLYIEIQDGQPINHPVLESNLLEVFDKIPNNWEFFLRVEMPTPDTYQVLNSQQPTYEKVNNVWTDVWPIRDMTTEEKTAKQQGVITTFNSREQAFNWSAWTLDEATCTMQPPIPRPAPVEGLDIRWCGAENNWKEVPARPVDDNQYKFDFLTWQWVQVVN
jgi:hypothetical protein